MNELEELSAIIKRYLTTGVDLPISSVRVHETEGDAEGIDVFVEIDRVRGRLNGESSLNVVRGAFAAVREAEETRFPYVFVRFADTQEFAA